MGSAKVRGIITNHSKRYHDDREIIPCKWIGKGRGKGIMVAQYKDTRDLVTDANGNPVPWNGA